MATVVIHTTEDTYRISKGSMAADEALNEVVRGFTSDGYYAARGNNKADLLYVPHHAVTAVHVYDD